MKQREGILSETDLTKLHNLISDTNNLSVKERTQIGRKLYKSVKCKSLELIKSENLEDILIGTLAIELLMSVKRGDIKLWQVSNTFAKLTTNTIFRTLLAHEPILNSDINKYIRIPNKAGILFETALQLAYQGDKFSWKQVYELIPDSNYNNLNVFKVSLKKQYERLDAIAGGNSGYSLLCNNKSRLYSPTGVKLLAEGYLPAQVENHLVNDAPLLVKVEDLVGEDVTVNFAEPHSAPLYLADIAKAAIKKAKL